MALGAFSGNFVHTIDAKGRVTIPASYREALGEDFTIGLSNQFNAIALYPKAQWEQIEADLHKIPRTDAKGMNYVRLINGNSFTGCEIDAQGRVLLPTSLRLKAGMDKNIRFVGIGQCLEIWDEERYQAEMEQAEMNSEELLKYVNDLYYRPNPA